MKFEMAPNPRTPDNDQPKRETSLRLRSLATLETKLFLGKIETLGKEHLKEILPGEKVIIAGSHISDMDMQVIISQLGKDFSIKVSGQSTHHSFETDSSGMTAQLLAGKDNFIPIDYSGQGDQKRAVRFNPKNFDSMAEALREGDSVLVAAHNPSSGKLPSGGVGIPYLSQLGVGNFVILPVAVDIKSNEPYRAGGEIKLIKEKPDTEVHIGAPIRLPVISGIEDYQKLLSRRKESEQPLSEEETNRLSVLNHELKEQSDIVMQSLANMLPEKKRGNY